MNRISLFSLFSLKPRRASRCRRHPASATTAAPFSSRLSAHHSSISAQPSPARDAACVACHANFAAKRPRPPASRSRPAGPRPRRFHRPRPGRRMYRLPRATRGDELRGCCFRREYARRPGSSVYSESPARRTATTRTGRRRRTWRPRSPRGPRDSHVEPLLRGARGFPQRRERQRRIHARRERRRRAPRAPRRIPAAARGRRRREAPSPAASPPTKCTRSRRSLATAREPAGVGRSVTRASVVQGMRKFLPTFHRLATGQSDQSLYWMGRFHRINDQRD